MGMSIYAQMGMSIYARISFGISFGEDYEFPWHDEKYDYDPEDWWIYEVRGYRNPFEILDEKGNFINGKQPSQYVLRQYFESRRVFLENNPLPVKIVYHCSSDYDMYIIAVHGSCRSALRGYPRSFDPNQLTVTDADKAKLIDFCEKYLKPFATKYSEFPKMEPKWYLSSYQG